MIELSTIRDLVTIFGVIAGFSYYVLTVQNSKRNQELQLEMRKAQLFEQIWQQYNSVEYAMTRFTVYDIQWENYEDFNKKYRDVPPEEKKAYASFISMGRLFEGLWIFIREELIDKDLAIELFRGDVIRWWEKFLPRLQDLEDRGIAHGFEKVEKLYEESKSSIENTFPGKKVLRDRTNR